MPDDIAIFIRNLTKTCRLFGLPDLVAALPREDCTVSARP